MAITDIGDLDSSPACIPAHKQRFQRALERRQALTVTLKHGQIVGVLGSKLVEYRRAIDDISVIVVIEFAFSYFGFERLKIGINDTAR